MIDNSANTTEAGFSLRCLLCERIYQPAPELYSCPEHPWPGTLDVLYPYQRLPRTPPAATVPALEQFRALLPLAPDSLIPRLGIGDTPLLRAARLEQLLGLDALWVKDETRQLSASLKDRASLIAVLQAQQQQRSVVATASTGNAAAALAGVCAALGQTSVVFVPQDIPAAKLAQIQIYAAQVVLVEGSYSEAFELCQAACARFGWYNRNTGFNPYMTEGKKLAAIEVCQQLAWQAPDLMLVPVGDGSIIGAMHKGFQELYQLGWIARIPRLLGVQAEGSDALYQAWIAGVAAQAMASQPAHSAADSLVTSLPADRFKALRAVRQSAGHWLRVSDAELFEAQRLLASTTGVFAEPAAAASLAGLIAAQAQGLVAATERVVLLITGSGLKAVEQLQAQSTQTLRAASSAQGLDRLEALLKERL